VTLMNVLVALDRGGVGRGATPYCTQDRGCVDGTRIFPIVCARGSGAMAMRHESGVRKEAGEWSSFS